MAVAMEVVGAFTVEATKRYRCESEFAAWFDEIEVEPCTVELRAEIEADGRVKDCGLYFKLDGPVVASNWTSYAFGQAIGDGRNKNLGKIATYHGFTYAHSVAKMIVEGKPSAFTLAPGFEAVPIDFVYDGKAGRSYGIRRVAACDACAKHYGDGGVCDQGKPVASPHRAITK